LEGPFNYCRSINEGLKYRHSRDSCALFLNDDVVFTQPGDLVRLKQTLFEQRWACVGPHILYNPSFRDETWPTDKSSLNVPRAPGATRSNAPVSGCCALWNLEWIDRIGNLDEKFGEGYGMDEADLCMRTLRLGGRYGRQDAVAIRHEMRGTFGARYTRYTGPAHMQSLLYFKHKYGQKINEWGRSHHWWPLPGVHVIIGVEPKRRLLDKCLESVERTLDGFRWILTISLSKQTGWIDEIIQNYANESCTADSWQTRRFCFDNKSDVKKIDQIAALSSEHKRDYPAICLISDEHQMGETFLRQCLWKARDNGYIGIRRGPSPSIPDEIAGRLQTEFPGASSLTINLSEAVFHNSLVLPNDALLAQNQNVESVRRKSTGLLGGHFERIHKG